MGTIHIAEKHQNISRIQEELIDSDWTMVKATMPYQSELTRGQWALNVERWLESNAETGWAGIAYIKDGVLYVTFEGLEDSRAFWAACEAEQF